MTDQREFYLNVRTGEVEEGKVSTWAERMGPYPTAEAAKAALATAEDRNEAWDAADKAWREDWTEE